MRIAQRPCMHQQVITLPHGLTDNLLFAVFRYLIEAAGVALVPGDAFGAPACLRISYAASMDVLKQAAARIAAALDRTKFSGLQ
jgi:aspartate/methionine/tyrosine aminotransferase